MSKASRAQELRDEARMTVAALSGRPALRRHFRVASVAVVPDIGDGPAEEIRVTLQPPNRSGVGYGDATVTLDVPMRGAAEWLPGSDVVASFVVARVVPTPALSFAAETEAQLVDYALGPQMARRLADYAEGTVLAHLVTHVGSLTRAVFSRAFARSAFGSLDELGFGYEVRATAAEVVAMCHLLLVRTVEGWERPGATESFSESVRTTVAQGAMAHYGRRVQGLTESLGRLAEAERMFRAESQARRHKASLVAGCADVAALALLLAQRGDEDIEQSMPPEEGASE